MIMLIASTEGYHSVHETIVGLLDNAHKLSHLGLSYLIRRNTLSESIARRTHVFEDIYMSVYQKMPDF